MASLGTLRPGAANTTNLPTTGSIIGNPGGSTALSDDSDTTYDGQNTNSSGTYQHGRELANMPTDFGTMATLSVQCRTAWQSTPSNSTWDDVAARVVGSNGTTILAAANSGGTFQSMGNPPETATYGLRPSSPQAFSYVNTSANKTAWDGAILQLQWVRTRSKGGDSLGMRISEAYVTGTYNLGAEMHSGSAHLAGGGVLSGAARKTAHGGLTLAGGGVETNAATGTHFGTTTATAGGTVAPSSLTDRLGSAAMTGGGVLTAAGEQGGAEAHSGTAALTGGGVLSLSAESARAAASLLTAGGVLTADGLSQRLGTGVLTGGGVLSPAATTGRLSGEALTGGGALSEASTTTRLDGETLTGGGVLHIASGSVEQHTGTAALTGGGSLSVSAASARLGAALLSGGGILAYAAETDKHGDAVLSGGGILTILQANGRFGTVNLTGGGSLIVQGENMALTDLGGVMDAIADAITAASITKRAYGYPADTISVPCVVVGYPDTIDFDLTYQRGADQAIIPVYFIAGRVTEKAARDQLSEVITGATGIKDTLDGNLGGVCQTLRVTDMKVLNIQVSGIDYLAAQFNAEVVM